MHKNNQNYWTSHSIGLAFSILFVLFHMGHQFKSFYNFQWERSIDAMQLSPRYIVRWKKRKVWNNAFAEPSHLGFQTRVNHSTHLIRLLWILHYLTYVKCFGHFFEQFLGHGRYSINVRHHYNFLNEFQGWETFPPPKKNFYSCSFLLTSVFICYSYSPGFRTEKEGSLGI